MHRPPLGSPEPGRSEHRLAANRPAAGDHRVDLSSAVLEAGDLNAFKDLNARFARVTGEVADRSDRVSPAAALLVQDRLDAFTVDVGPEPFEVFGAGRVATGQLGFEANFALALGDRLEVLALGFGYYGEVSDLMEAEAFGVAFKDSNRLRDHLGHRLGAVVVADNPAGDA